jgi:hypothetical protein
VEGVHPDLIPGRHHMWVVSLLPCGVIMTFQQFIKQVCLHFHSRFLSCLAGELMEYVTSELNVLSLSVRMSHCTSA